MSTNLNYVLWGSSGHAKVLASLISLYKGEVIALFDNDPNATPVLSEVPLFIGRQGFIEWYKNRDKHRDVHGLVAIGGSSGSDRLEIYFLFQEHGLITDPIVHPMASLCPMAKLGQGTQILANATVAADAQIGDACIINHNASVDHECILGDGVHIAPGATLCGCVVLGKNVMIGANAVVLPRIEIGENTIVGSGSVVTKHLPSNCIAYGNPAQSHGYQI